LNSKRNIISKIQVQKKREKRRNPGFPQKPKNPGFFPKAHGFYIKPRVFPKNPKTHGFYIKPTVFANPDFNRICLMRWASII
jgi:hypothetical protein